jgi:hypothetical protein
MRLLPPFRVAYGSVLLLAPHVIAGALPHEQVDGRVVAFARLLGARHLLEAAIIGRRNRPAWILAGSAVDATHAATMIGLAVARPNRRPLALANAIAAGAIAVAGAAQALDRSRSRPAARCGARPARCATTP